MGRRPELTSELVDRFRSIIATLRGRSCWVRVRWRVGKSTIAHLLGGEDGQFRVTVRGDPDEVMAFEHMGPPYYRAGWGCDMIGMILTQDTDWNEVAELITMSYCLQAPAKLAADVEARGRVDGTTRERRSERPAPVFHSPGPSPLAPK